MIDIRQYLLSLPPETAHHLAQILIRLRYSSFFPQAKTIEKPVHLLGLSFKNPIGLAAGWDKNGECFDALFRLGFGFVEVGTVTPKPQEGNPKPRLFRLPEKNALINRMGFNNAGVDALVERLKKRKTPGVLGVNIGKNKETSLDNALSDYQICLKAVYPYADYVVVNISSPNTPGLRELQSAHYLQNLCEGLCGLKRQLSSIYQNELPLLIKTTVDLPVSDYESFVQILMANDINGIIISNTTIDHSAVLDLPYGNEAGGLSGAPLRSRVTEMIAKIHQISEKKLPIIGVGGILSAEDALAHIEAGASLLQIFSGFVYRGPKLVGEILDGL